MFEGSSDMTYSAWMFRYVFFCQAEDGIRYLVRSRGLGDVYKRQEIHRVFVDVDQHFHSGVGKTRFGITHGCGRVTIDRTKAVSYTHLTLPTSDLV